MNRELINIALLAGMFLLLFCFTEILFYKFKIKADNTRKIVHIGTGLITIFFPLMLHSQWSVLFLCSSFALILFFSITYHFLPSINAIARVSYGSLLYPLAVYISFLFYNYFNKNLVFFYLPVLTMAVCDPIAAHIGKRWPSGKFTIMHSTKTITGSAAFFISSVFITITLSFFLKEKTTINHLIFLSLSIAIVATFAEAMSSKGFDNITIPISVLLVLILFYD